MLSRADARRGRARGGTARASAYVADSGNGHQLVVRALGELMPRVIRAANVRQPFFSPDGKWIGYFDHDSLQKVSLEGGRPVTLVAELSNAAWVRGSWSDDGRIVYDTWNAGLRVVSADGGEVSVLTQPKDEWHLGPEAIPGTTTLLFFTQSATGFRIEAIGLDGSGSAERSSTTRASRASSPPGIFSSSAPAVSS